MARRRAREDLVGRQWAFDRIAEWLRSGTGSLVVTGAAGTGKTALVAALAGGAPGDRVGPPHAVHLCRGHILASTDPLRVLAVIARPAADGGPRAVDGGILQAECPGHSPVVGPYPDPGSPKTPQPFAAGFSLGVVNPTRRSSSPKTARTCGVSGAPWPHRVS